MNRLSQSTVMEESEVREVKKWRRASALWFLGRQEAIPGMVED